MKGCLNTRKWLVPKMSYGGRILVINNLVASVLLHKIACIDPPLSLLIQIQSMLLDFFWDKLHWVPHGMLYLPREKGGQGLGHLQSRTATFRLQFLQKYLSGSEDICWKLATSVILRTLPSRNRQILFPYGPE